VPFLAQIDFAAMPRWDASPLPADGWLYSFGLYENGREWVTAVHCHRSRQSELARAPLPTAGEIWLNQDNEPAYEPLPLV
jgi:hypothetical protein